MAFDQPLEADKVEDNLLVSLVSHSLMWILADNNEQQANKKNELLEQGLQNMVLDDIDSDEDESGPNKPNNKSLPRLVRSDLSVAMDTSYHGEQREQPNPQYDDCTMPFMRHQSSSSDSIHSNNSKQRTVKKKMSWSNNLVEYLDEVSRKMYAAFVIYYCIYVSYCIVAHATRLLPFLLVSVLKRA